MSDKILLVGCGKMGAALLGGWRARGITAADIAVVEPDEAARVRLATENKDQILAVASPADLAGRFAPNVILFAVKPQSMDKVVPDYAAYAATALFVSIAAGKTIAYFQKHLGGQAAIVRVMPNTPAAIGRGISVGVANPTVSTQQKSLAAALLEAVGEFAWAEDEALIDGVTALSGSGPAYVFLLVEAMTAAGITAGLPADLSLRLARATVSGSGELLHQSRDDAATLRRNVTSPGGTTEAALKILMAEDGLTALMTRAIQGAADRSRELAG